MVVPLSSSLLLPAELADTMSRYKSTVTGSGIEEPFLNKIMTLFSADLEELNDAITAVRDNPLIDEVAEADAMRDDLFICFRDMVDAYKRRRKPELIAAYEKIWAIIAKTGTTAYKLGYTEESGKLAAMFSELAEPENQAFLTTLNVLDTYTELAESEDNFISIFKSRLDEDLQIQYPTLQQAKNKAVPHVNAFISALGVLDETEPDTYTGLVGQINSITEQITTVVKARKTRKENEGQDES